MTRKEYIKKVEAAMVRLLDAEMELLALAEDEKNAPAVFTTSTLPVTSPFEVMLDQIKDEAAAKMRF